MSERESGQSNLGKLLVGGILVTLAIVAFLVSRGQRGDDNGTRDPEVEQHLAQTRTALALTENMESESAEEVWSKLLEAFPTDSSLALNRALNRVLLVDALAGKATNPLIEVEEKRAARQKLPEAISLARSGVTAYEEISGDQVTSLWLGSRVDLQEASLLPAAMTKSLRRGIFDRLTESLSGELGKSAQSVILAGPLTEVLDQLKDPIDGLPRELLGKATESIGALSDRHDENLFLALRAARLNIESRSQAAKKFVNRTAKLASAIRPLLNETTKPIGMTANELVIRITTAIKAGNWNDAANRMLQWFNVLNPSEMLKTDRRRASPHPLDRLSFETLRRLSAAAILSDPIDQGGAAISFRTSTLEQSSEVGMIKPVDYNLDLVSDIAAITNDGKVQLWTSDAGDWMKAGEITLDIQPMGLCVADLFMVDSSDPNRIKTESDSTEAAEQDFSTSSRHDTFPGLIAYGDEGVRLIALDGRRRTANEDRMKTIDKPSGLTDVKGVIKILTGDLEGDGDLDLIIATRDRGLQLFINRGNRTFFEATDHRGGFDASDPVADMAIADIDRDLDLDVVTLHASGHVGILENLLHLQFRGRVIDEIPRTPGASSISIADVDGNVSWDVVIAGTPGTSLVFSQTADAGIWTVESVETDKTAMAHATVADLDNDSWSELVAGDASGSRALRIGPWGLSSPHDLKTIKISGGPLHAGDFNSDGKLDLAAINEGKIEVAVNETESTGHYMDVRFKGIADNAANSGRVNHFAIGSVLELRFGPHYRSQIITTPATHFGIDGYDAASSLRVIFPNGLTQTIRDPSVDTIVEEEQSLKGSCPYLYAWDGEKFVFMTDCLWAAPLGLQVARGVVAKDRPWEYLKVDGQHVQPRDGRYEFRITEELWEVAYLEKVGLTTIDHPSDVQIWTNEKVGPAEIAEPTVFAFRDTELQTLASAADNKGRDVTEPLRERDRDFVQGFDRRLRQGLCPPHWIDLDFGELASEEKSENAASIFLVLTGWILPTDTSLNIQIDQNPELPPIEFPSVWVPDAEQPDGWRQAIPFMGFPGGKTKTIVVDVTNVIDPNDPRLRIRTSAQIYWDAAKLAVQTEPAPFVQQSAELLSAELAYRGFSQRINDGPRRPESYDYQRSTKLPRWPPLRGSLTQFGSCDDLVREWDDEMIVMGSGDELRLTFSVPDSPPAEGWTRDFVLHCVGWDKDADLNTLAGQTTGPLPHRQMGQYPPTTASLAESRVVEEKNRVHLQRTQSFRAFWHRSEESQASRFLPPVFDGSSP